VASAHRSIDLIILTWYFCSTRVLISKPENCVHRNIPLLLPTPVSVLQLTVMTVEGD
jgi:hypothetical protein